LVPDHKFPIAVEEAVFATGWVFEHCQSLGFDPGRLVVSEDSAGGNLAAVVAQIARKKE
jgi:acetyl esterase